VFDTQFQTETGGREYAWQTSWGSSTRLMGALIMGHGDDNGLRVPPVLAPTQAVVLLIRGDDGAGEVASSLAEELRTAGVRVKLDDRLETSFGRRVTEWELRGIPVRIEVGPRDLAEGNVTLVRRDTSEKTAVPLATVAERVGALLGDIQSSMFGSALERQSARTSEVTSIAEAVEAAQTGFASLPYSLVGEAGEDELNASGVSVRCLQTADGGLPLTVGDDTVAFVARAY
jgi:prolyl-tRNA synthetase